MVFFLPEFVWTPPSEFNSGGSFCRKDEKDEIVEIYLCSLDSMYSV